MRTVVTQNRSLTLGLVLALMGGALLSGPRQACGANPDGAKFTGSLSCSSSSCHGGGAGHNQMIIYEQRDIHAISYGLLAKGTSQRICEALKIAGDPNKAAQCNVCHAPMQGVPLERLTAEARNDKGVACEACHGPAENWLRLHTRADVSLQQAVAAGMRNLNDLYGRANTCVACHLNLDASILRAGHPELSFELDQQTVDEPPHYQDARPALGARQWLTGQATALREFSWKLSGQADATLLPRWKALRWLLRKTELGKKTLSETEDYSATQRAADQLAHEAADAVWTKQQLAALLRNYTGLHREFTDAKVEKLEQRRRAEVLLPAIYRLWLAYKKEGGSASDGFDAGLKNSNLSAMAGDFFDPEKFASSLDGLQLALPKDAQ